MTPAAAISASLKGAFRFSGRAGRSEFWWSFAILYLVIALTSGFAKLPHAHPAVGTLLMLAAYALMLPLVAVGTRRLTDAGVWRWLFVLTFLFGQFTMLFFLFARPELRGFWLNNVYAERAEITLPYSGYEASQALRVLRDDIFPWAARLLGLSCLVLAALPTRHPQSGSHTPEVTP